MTYHEVTDGTRIFYTDTGQGRPVLLLHGWACDSNDWSRQGMTPAACDCKVRD